MSDIEMIQYDLRHRSCYTQLNNYFINTTHISACTSVYYLLNMHVQCLITIFWYLLLPSVLLTLLVGCLEEHPACKN